MIKHFSCINENTDHSRRFDKNSILPLLNHSHWFRREWDQINEVIYMYIIVRVSKIEEEISFSFESKSSGCRIAYNKLHWFCLSFPRRLIWKLCVNCRMLHVYAVLSNVLFRHCHIFIDWRFSWGLCFLDEFTNCWRIHNFQFQNVAGWILRTRKQQKGKQFISVSGSVIVHYRVESEIDVEKCKCLCVVCVKRIQKYTCFVYTRIFLVMINVKTYGYAMVKVNCVTNKLLEITP